MNPFKVLWWQLQFTCREGPSKQTVWGAHSLSECMGDDGVATAWLWKALKGAVVLCCSISLTTLKCTVFEMYQYFSRAAFTVRCGRSYNCFLAESQEFKGTGSTNLWEHRRQNHKASNEENLFLRLQYIIKHFLCSSAQARREDAFYLQVVSNDSNWQNAS